MKSSSPWRTSIAAVEAVFVTQVIARQANLRTLLSSILPKSYRTLNHHTMELEVNMGLITMV
jgi:hypothetical protein